MKPIEIMDEIERKAQPPEMQAYLLNRLRTALEAQAEELAQAHARIAHLETQVKGLEFHISTRPSLAAVKAAVLHQFGDRLFAEQANDPNQDFAKLAHDEADRIERAAKEEA